MIQNASQNLVFGYKNVSIAFFLKELTMYKILTSIKYIIVTKNTGWYKKLCLKFPCTKFITHLVPPQLGHKIPKYVFIKHFGIIFIRLFFTIIKIIRTKNKIPSSNFNIFFIFEFIFISISLQGTV